MIGLRAEGTECTSGYLYNYLVYDNYMICLRMRSILHTSKSNPRPHICHVHIDMCPRRLHTCATLWGISSHEA